MKDDRSFKKAKFYLLGYVDDDKHLIDAWWDGSQDANGGAAPYVDASKIGQVIQMFRDAGDVIYLEDDVLYLFRVSDHTMEEAPLEEITVRGKKRLVFNVELGLLWDLG